MAKDKGKTLLFWHQQFLSCFYFTTTKCTHTFFVHADQRAIICGYIWNGTYWQ
jgi:hypothetical protein